MVVLELKNICKSFNEKVVLDNFSMKLESRSFVAICGASGCGKSTLLNIIGLLEKPDSGSIELFGNVNVRPYSNTASKLLRDKIGYLFQSFALIDNESVEYNLKISLEEVKDKNKDEKMMNALEKVGLEKNYLKKKIYECSGGEQQRIAVARLLLKPCELILADEPTGSLDEDNKKEIWNLLMDLRSENKTIVVVTHDLELAKMCDKVIDLSKK